MSVKLQVHLLMSEDLLEKEDRKLLKQLEEKYPDQFHFLITKRIYTIVPHALSEENHVKLLIIDEKYFAMGGTGIHEKMGREIVPVERDGKGSYGSKFLDKTFRDSDIIGRGSVAKTMRNQFFNLYRIWEHRTKRKAESRYFDVEGKKGVCSEFEKKENLIKGASLKFIVAGPEHRRNNPITNELSQLISGAQKEIRLASLLFNPHRKIKFSLAERKRAGLKIAGYFNGTKKNSTATHHIYALPCRINYNLLTVAHEHEVEKQLYHKKVTTIDEDITVIGSTNLGVKSAICDYESVCVIKDPRVTDLMKKALKEDSHNSIKYKKSKLNAKRRQSLFMGGIISTFLGPFFG